MVAWRRNTFFAGQLVGGVAYRLMMAGQQALHGLAQVLQQMSSISDLHGLRRALEDSVCIGTGTISSHHPYSGLLLQPGLDRRCIAIRQQLNGARPLKANNGSIMVASPICPAINANLTR